MPAVRSWKFLGLTTPRAFGGCRWAGTVCNENPGRGGRELGNGRCKGGTGRRQRARSREPADRHRPPCPSPRVPRSHQVTGARVAGPGWRLERAAWRSASGIGEPGAPGPGRRRPRRRAVTEEMGLSSGPQGGPQPGRERGRPQRGRAPPRGNGAPEAVPCPGRPASPPPPPPPLRGPPRSPSPSGGRYGRSLGTHEALGESG